MAQDNGPLAAVRRGVSRNVHDIGRVAGLRQRRAELGEMQAMLLRYYEEVDGQYQVQRQHLQSVADRLNRRLASMGRHSAYVDQGELLEAVLLVMREFDGYDEDAIEVMRAHVLQLMSIAVEGAPVLTLTRAGWVGSRVESGMRLEGFGSADGMAWQLVIPFAVGEGAVHQFTIPFEVCDDDLLKRLTGHDLYVGGDAISQFLAGCVVQPHSLHSPGTLRQAVIDAGLDGDLCNNIAGV